MIYWADMFTVWQVNYYCHIVKKGYLPKWLPVKWTAPSALTKASELVWCNSIQELQWNSYLAWEVAGSLWQDISQWFLKSSSCNTFVSWKGGRENMVIPAHLAHLRGQDGLFVHYLFFFFVLIAGSKMSDSLSVCSSYRDVISPARNSLT